MSQTREIDPHSTYGIKVSDIEKEKPPSNAEALKWRFLCQARPSTSRRKTYCLQLVGNAREGLAHAGTQRGDGADDDDGDQGGDQGVFDGGHSALVELEGEGGTYVINEHVEDPLACVATDARSIITS